MTNEDYKDPDSQKPKEPELPEGDLEIQHGGFDMDDPGDFDLDQPDDLGSDKPVETPPRDFDLDEPVKTSSDNFDDLGELEAVDEKSSPSKPGQNSPKVQPPRAKPAPRKLNNTEKELLRKLHKKIKNFISSLSETTLSRAEKKVRDYANHKLAPAEINVFYLAEKQNTPKPALNKKDLIISHLLEKAEKQITKNKIQKSWAGFLKKNLGRFLKIRFYEGEISYQDYLKQKEATSPARRFEGQKGALCIGNTTIGEAAMVQKNDAFFLEICPPGITITNEIFFQIQANLTLELGRIHSSFEEIANLAPGALIPLRQDIYNHMVSLCLNDMQLALGELVITQERLGIRVTDLPEGISPYNSFAPSSTAGPKEPMQLAGKIILGEKRLSFQEITQLEESAIILTEGLPHLPARLLYENGACFYAEVVSIQKELYLKILEDPETQQKRFDKLLAFQEQGTLQEYLSQVEATQKFEKLTPEKINKTAAEAPEEFAELVCDFDEYWEEHPLCNEEPLVSARILSMLTEKNAAKVFQYFPPKALQNYTRKLASLKLLLAQNDENSLRLFGSFFFANHERLRGRKKVIELLEKTVGKEKADQILQKLPKSQSFQKKESETPFEWLQEEEPALLIKALQDELPQTITLVLSHLDPTKSTEILKGLSQEFQAEITRRMMHPIKTGLEYITLIEKELLQTTEKLKKHFSKRSAGIKLIIELLSRLEPYLQEDLINLLRNELPYYELKEFEAALKEYKNQTGFENPN